MANVWNDLLTHFKNEKLMTFSNMIVMTVTFLLLGIFIYVIVFSQTALKYLEGQAQLTVFFKDDFTEEKITFLKGNLLKDQRISEVTYVSKEEALRIFKEMNKDEPILLESISASVLPASLEIKAKNISDLKQISDELKKNDGVEEVRFFEDIIGKFTSISRIFYIVGFILVAAFFIISYSVIIAGLRTAINSHGPELEIMKLVGASDTYVKRPFLIQGLLFGLASSSIASILLLIFSFGLSNIQLFSKGLSFGFISGVYLHPLAFSLLLSLILIISGCLLGYFGSYTAVKKYLKY